MPHPELSKYAELRDRWVALAPQGTTLVWSATRRRSAASMAPPLALPSGQVVVDVDDELDELCARISRAEQTSLSIVYVGSTGVAQA